MKTLWSLLLLLLLPQVAAAQLSTAVLQSIEKQYDSAGRGIYFLPYVVARLPVPDKQPQFGPLVVGITDGADSSDCTVGLGTNRHLCMWNGSVWVAVGAGGGGGGTPGGAANSIQYNNAGAFGGFGSWNGTTLAIPGSANSLSLAGSSTGNPVTIISSGSDINIPIVIRPKGYNDGSVRSFVLISPDDTVNPTYLDDISANGLWFEADDNASGVVIRSGYAPGGFAGSGTLSLLGQRGSLASPAIVEAEDLVGNILFAAYDGAHFINAFNIEAIVDGAPTTGSVMQGRLEFRVNEGNSSTLAFQIDHLLNINIPGLTASLPVATDASKNLVSTSTLNIAKLSNLTSNGFVKTSGGDGTLSIDGATYLTAAGAVTSIKKTGDSALVGAVTLTGGTNVTLMQSGQDISIAATGGTSLTDSASLRAALSDENGTGVALFDSNTSATFITPAITTSATITRTVNATSADGLLLTNTTAAAAGAQQWSPRLHLHGSGWKTASTAGPQDVDWIVENVPVQGAANPTTNLKFSSSVNGAAYTQQLMVTSDGQILASGAIPAYSFAGDTTSGLRIGGSGPVMYEGTVQTALFNRNYVQVVALAVGGTISTPDTYIYRDGAANIIAQRNSTNAQTFRVYGTFTDTSNYERATLSTQQGTSITLAAETAGTGGDNLSIFLVPAGTGRTKSATPFSMISSGGAAVTGNATLVGGTVTVNTTAALTGSSILLTRKTSGGTIGTAITYTISNGTSFTINSDNILDTSTFTWVIVDSY